MPPIYLPKLIAWLATVLCVIASARGATVFATNNSRVFTILALFSLNWALLIPYYSDSAPSELIAGFAGFLLVYIGILLRREARERSARHQENLSSALESNSNKNGSEDVVGREDRAALWILRLLIVPSVISLPFPTTENNFLSRTVTEPIVGSVITLLGYYSVWSAIQIYSTNRKGKLLISAVIIPYAVVDFAFSSWLIFYQSAAASPCSTTPTDYWRNSCSMMPAVFMISFAALKLLFSGIFIYLVLNESLSAEDREQPTIDKILKFVGI